MTTVPHAYNLSTRQQKQKDHFKFKASLVYSEFQVGQVLKK